MENIFTQQEQKQYYELALQKIKDGEYAVAEELLQLLQESFLQEQDYESYIKVNIELLRILVNSQRHEEMFDYILAIEPYIKDYATKSEQLSFRLIKAIFENHMGIQSPIPELKALLEEAIEINDIRHIFRAANNLLHSYAEEKKTEEGYALIERITPYLEQADGIDLVGPMVFYINSLDIYYARKDFDKIEKDLMKLEENSMYKAIPSLEFPYWSIKGLFILHQGEIEKAKYYFEKAYSMIKDKFYFVQDIERWVHAMKEHGEIEQAFYYQSLLVDALQEHIVLEKKVRRSDIISKFSTSGVVERLHHDRLSGAKSRAYFEEQLEKNREVIRYSVAVFDIDKFKVINDTYGHLVGDQAIKFIASIAMKWMPKNDMKLIRYGGDEFIIFMPYPKEEIEESIRHLLRLIAQSDFIVRGTGDVVNFQVSIGISYTDETPATLLQLFETADHALYYAKQNGRNQVRFREVKH
ncbi:MAG: GGDEF domain-containing protein [Lysinibacillus sp.]